MILNAVEGWGKTTIGAYAPKPVILMAGGETGYQTLLNAGSVPSVSAVTLNTWPEMISVVEQLVDSEYETLVLDALSGFERLCHTFVCDRDFGGDWGEHGFVGWQRGYAIAVPEWLKLLSRLETANKTGKTILILSHCLVRPFKNPTGPDYDRYVADIHAQTWGPTHRWADAVLFGTYVAVIEGGKTGEKPRKGKGIGRDDRVMYTRRRDAWDAKNRFSMSEAIDFANDPASGWATLWAAIMENVNA